jgi:type 1 glutamine amidotransferase
VAKVVDMAVARATGVVVEVSSSDGSSVNLVHDQSNADQQIKDTPAVVVTVEASSREAAEDGNKYLRLSPTMRRSDIEKEKSAWVAAKVNCVVGHVGCHLAMAVAGQPRGLWKRVYLGELIRSAWR